MGCNRGRIVNRHTLHEKRGLIAAKRHENTVAERCHIAPISANWRWILSNHLVGNAVLWSNIERKDHCTVKLRVLSLVNT